MTLALVTLLSVLASCPTTSSCEKGETPRALRTYARSHGELSIGYLGQWSDERTRGFELRTSTGPQELAGAVVDPFLGTPFTAAVQAGPTIESRTVFDGVRFIAGLRLPFTGFRPSESAQRLTLNGTEHDVLVRSVSLWEFRTGLGFEVPFRRVTPFVDVLGDVSTLTTQLAIDGNPATYRSTGFSFGGRLGARVQLSRVFVQVAAEAMAIGPVRLGGSLQAGVAL